MSERPFRVLGIQQIAIGGRSKDALSRLWVDLFGIPVADKFVSESENVDEYILRLGPGPHAVEIDLMEPLEFGRRPLVFEPALNHVGLWVDDLQACVEWMTDQGVRFAPGGIRTGAGGREMCFVHPKGDEESPLSGEGVLIELVQAPPEVVTALGGNHDV